MERMPRDTKYDRRSVLIATSAVLAKYALDWGLPRVELNRLGSQPSQITTQTTKRDLLSTLPIFLKTAANTASSLTSTGIFTGNAEEVKTAIDTVVKRPFLKDNKLLEVSDEALSYTWQKYFPQKGKASFLNYYSWSFAKYVDGKPAEYGVGRNLSVFANLCYQFEKTKGEDFNSYYKRYVDRLYETAKLAGLDFTVLVTSLKISGENILGKSSNDTLEGQTLDLKVHNYQDLLVPAARFLGLEYALLRRAGPVHEGVPLDGDIAALFNAGRDLKKMLDDIRKRKPSTDSIHESGSMPPEGMGYYNLLRFHGEDTIGMMDFQPSEHAMAALHPTNEKLYSILKRDYPTMAKDFANIVNTRAQVDMQKKQLQELIDAYIERFPNSLRPFGIFDQQMMDAIGLGDSWDIWQNTNYTESWYQNVQVPLEQDKDACTQAIKQAITNEYSKDPSRFYKKFMRNQILNPRFIQALKKQAQDNHQDYELDLITKLEDARATYQQQATLLIVAVYKNMTHQGEQKLEYDSTFQMLTAIMTTKRLSERAGTFNPDDRDSVYWNAYKLIAIREITPPYILVDNVAGIMDPTIDGPYSPEKVLQKIEEFSDALFKKGILAKPANKDVVQFMYAIQKFRQQEWQHAWPKIPETDLKELNDFFTKYLVSRLYTNPTKTHWAEYPPIVRSQELLDLIK